MADAITSLDVGWPGEQAKPVHRNGRQDRVGVDW